MKWLRIYMLGYCFISLNLFAEEPLTEVNIQLKWLHQFQFAGYYAAIEQGFYREEGLKVNLIERRQGPTPIDELILGNVDYAIAGVGALIYRVNGVPLVALAATFQHSPSILLSRYKKIEDLKDKRIMLSRGVMNAEITSMLRKAGLDLNDIDIIPSNQSLDGFVNGLHDAYNGYTTNEIYRLNLKNIPYHVFHPKDYGIDFYGDILLTTENKIKNHTDEVRRFRRATLKGWEYAINNVDEIVDLIKQKYNSQNKSKTLLEFEAKELIKLIYSNIVPIGYMNEIRWQAIGRVLQETGDLPPGAIDIHNFLYDHYLQTSLLDAAIDNFKKILLFVAIIIGILAILHYYRLKSTVKAKTKDLDAARQKAERDARTDPLTTLANRRYFMEVISHDLSIAKRNNLELSLIYIDIDWFKNVNDSLGHSAGDESLKALAEIIKRNVRASDTPARIGGEEFVIVCLEKAQKSAIHLAERIRIEVEQYEFSYQNEKFHLTVSLGVTSISGEETVEQILRNCDNALYKAKKSGRNQVQWL